MGIETNELLYIQALELYPYDLEECIEKLQYLISSDDNHVGAHYLFGRIYQEQLHDYAKAKFHYQTALGIDHKYVLTYNYYAGLLIDYNAYEEAIKILAVGFGIPGMDIAQLYYVEGIMNEKQELWEAAKQSYKKGKIKALNSDYRSFLDKQIERVQAKEKELAPKQDDKKVKKKKKKQKK